MFVIISSSSADRAHWQWTGWSAVEKNIDNERLTVVCQCRVVDKTLHLDISRCDLANNVKTLFISACSTISFLRSTNEVIVNFWRCRCRWRRPVGRGVLSAEWVMIISYLASPSRVIVSLKPQLHIMENLDKLKRVKERNGASEKTEKKGNHLSIKIGQYKMQTADWV